MAADKDVRAELDKFADRRSRPACPRFIIGRPEVEVPVPARIQSRLEAARTAEAVVQVIREEEAKLAEAISQEEYLVCDQATDLVSDVLQAKGIPHQVALGHSNEGSSHVWIVIGRKCLDPTDQGFCTGEFEVVLEFDGTTMKDVRKPGEFRCPAKRGCKPVE